VSAKQDSDSKVTQHTECAASNRDSIIRNAGAIYLDDFTVMHGERHLTILQAEQGFADAQVHEGTALNSRLMGDCLHRNIFNRHGLSPDQWRFRFTKHQQVRP
jgi:hypothetical protein